MLVILDAVLGQVNSLSEYLQSPKIIFTRAMDLTRATVATLRDMRSEEMFENIWKEAAAIAKTASVPIPSDDGSSQLRRMNCMPKRLQDTVVSSSLGSRDNLQQSIRDRNRRVFYSVIDNFCGEIGKRLLDNDSLYQLLEVSDPKHEKFLDRESLHSFCEKFPRFGVDEELLICQSKVAINLFRENNFETPEACLEFLLPMSAGFDQVIKYLSMVQTFPVTSASCERSFSALKRIKTYTRSTMGDHRLSALALLSIKKDLALSLYQDPSPVIDLFAERKERRLSFSH